MSDLHRQNMEAMGGLAKSWSVFEAIRDIFTYDKHYRVYMAEKDGLVIARLLVFYYGKVAEYFTPASLDSYRVYQPMSLLIYEAMQEAARRGCRYWNWGGTWLTQDGVYFFKSRWGTEDRPYYYYISEHEGAESLRNLTKEEIIENYPYFYVLPFNILRQNAG